MAAELKKEIEIIDFDLNELTSLGVIAKRPNIKNLLTNETNRLTKRKNELLKEIKDLPSAEANLSESTSSMSLGQPSMGTVALNNYMWDQTDDFVKIIFEFDKSYSLDSSQIQMNFPKTNAFSVVFGKYKFTISKLFDDINGLSSYHKIPRAGKVIFYLKKGSKKNWSSIKSSDNEVDNKIKKTMDEGKDQLDDPSAGLMKLMKQMYDEGDDDMKRTIAKSWYESRNKNTSEADIKSDDFPNI